VFLIYTEIGRQITPPIKYPSTHIESASLIAVIGRSRDLGLCVSIKKDANPCSAWFDKRVVECCEYHVMFSTLFSRERIERNFLLGEDQSSFSLSFGRSFLCVRSFTIFILIKSFTIRVECPAPQSTPNASLITTPNGNGVSSWNRTTSTDRERHTVSPATSSAVEEDRKIKS
jgi:hypothetical protein